MYGMLHLFIVSGLVPHLASPNWDPIEDSPYLCVAYIAQVEYFTLAMRFYPCSPNLLPRFLVLRI